MSTMNNSVEPKVGMPVEHSLDGQVKKVQVIKVFPSEKKHQLGYPSGNPYANPRPNKELVRVGEKADGSPRVIWNHD